MGDRDGMAGLGEETRQDQGTGIRDRAEGILEDQSADHMADSMQGSSGVVAVVVVAEGDSLGDLDGEALEAVVEWDALAADQGVTCSTRYFRSVHQYPTKIGMTECITTIEMIRRKATEISTW
jgi:hypothetical protein